MENKNLLKLEELLEHINSFSDLPEISPQWVIKNKDRNVNNIPILEKLIDLTKTLLNER